MYIIKEVPQMPAQLSGDMGQLVNSDLFSDVQFSVDGRIFHGHKAILVVRSNFFQAMFCDQMRESTTSVCIYNGFNSKLSPKV